MDDRTEKKVDGPRRLQKVLAAAGIASRRHAEELIKDGRVTVNGRRATIGQCVNPVLDVILVDGTEVREERKVYYAFYKPKGVVTTMGEEHGGRTVAHLLGDMRLEERVFPVGRLDADAEGLLILTNDGDMANMISHPRYETIKEYEVLLDRPFEAEERLRRGVLVDGRRVDVDLVRCDDSRVTLRIHEGRNHIVKRLLKKTGYTVKGLKRTRIGPLSLGDLSPGALREISRKELTG